MNNIRLFHPENIIENTTDLLSKEHTHYVVNVMRLKRGSNLNFFNKDGEWLSEIIFLDRDRVEVKFLNKIKKSINSFNIELAICLVKKSPMETILQKATELGVNKIIPIVSERTEVKEINFERANKIVIEATEQSNRINVPIIEESQSLDSFLKNNKTDLIFTDLNTTNKKIDLNQLTSNPTCVIIGPEGDFSEEEREQILNYKGVQPIKINENILRSETAVISALSILNYVIN